MEPLLEIIHINKSFDGLKVLEDVSLTLAKGTITALFGENGSGKTVLCHIITGFLKGNSGEVLYKGQTLNAKTPVEVSKIGVGRVWQTPRICKNLSVSDNLIMAAKDHPGDAVLNYFIHPGLIRHEEKIRKAKADIISANIGLNNLLHDTAGSLSFGQQKLLSVGMLLMNEAELLVLDEPFAGIDSLMIDHISGVLIELKNQGKTILMIEHNRTIARAISDRSLLLIKGKIQKEA